jgi:pseudouridine-5'-monophosphatase
MAFSSLLSIDSVAMITHFVFDLDGLLLNTEDIYTVATNQFLAPYGKQFPLTLKTKMMGRKPLVSAKLLVDELDLPITPEQYIEAVSAIQDKLWKTCELTPGAGRILDYAFRNSIQSAVATGSPNSIYIAKTSHHKAFFEQFHTIVCGDDPHVLNGKPAPDIFLVAAERLGALPQNCLVFEDAPNGIQAANAAGMRSVWIPHTFMLDKEELQCGMPLQNQSIVKKMNATRTYMSLNDFQPDDFGLPSTW